MQNFSKNYIRFDFNSGKYSTHYGMIASATDLKYGDQKIGCMNIEYHAFKDHNQKSVLSNLILRFQIEKGIVRQKTAFGF
jgi:hypothetical protein